MRALGGRHGWAIIVAILCFIGALGSFGDGNAGAGFTGLVLAGGFAYLYARGRDSNARPPASKDIRIVTVPASAWAPPTEAPARPAMPVQQPPPPAPAAPASSEPHRPAPPTGTPTRAWSVDREWTEVVGEAYHDAEIRAIFRERGVPLTIDGGELNDVTAQVVPDPSNPFDPNAVAVWVEGQHVGFLGRDDAALYAGPLDDLADEDAHLEVHARVWARLQADWDDRRGRLEPNGRVSSRITVILPPPTGVLPFNALPEEAFAVIPPGSTMQVTGEENHMEALTRYVSDSARHVAVTLHLVQEAKTPRSTPYEAVEVRLDGQRVGVLTKHMSEQLRDVVAHVEGRGRVAVCRAVLIGSPLRAEVTLKVCKSAEVTSTWLESIPLG